MADLARTIEDRLREEYFLLLPRVRRVVEQLETEIRYHLLPISKRLEPYERLVVKSRVKECESAIDALRRRQEAATFNAERPDLYSLRDLNDLAGIRVLVFPRSRQPEIEKSLRSDNSFASWTFDPVEDDGELTALKYHGYTSASDEIKGEFQIVSMLTGLFWEVEHAAIYKPVPALRGVTRLDEMQWRYTEVLRALRAFEDEFEASVRRSRENAQTYVTEN